MITDLTYAAQLALSPGDVIRFTWVDPALAQCHREQVGKIATVVESNRRNNTVILDWKSKSDYANHSTLVSEQVRADIRNGANVWHVDRFKCRFVEAEKCNLKVDDVIEITAVHRQPEMWRCQVGQRARIAAIFPQAGQVQLDWENKHDYAKRFDEGSIRDNILAGRDQCRLCAFSCRIVEAENSVKRTDPAKAGDRIKITAVHDLSECSVGRLNKYATVTDLDDGTLFLDWDDKYELAASIGSAGEHIRQLLLNGCDPIHMNAISFEIVPGQEKPAELKIGDIIVNDGEKTAMTKRKNLLKPGDVIIIPDVRTIGPLVSQIGTTAVVSAADEDGYLYLNWKKKQALIGHFPDQRESILAGYHVVHEDQILYKVITGGQEMANEKEGLTDKIKTGITAVGASGKEGLKLAAADEGATLLTDKVKKALRAVGVKYPDTIAEHPIGKEIEPCFLSAITRVALEVAGDTVPKSAFLKRQVDRAVTATSKDAAQALKALATPFLEALMCAFADDDS